MVHCHTVHLPLGALLIPCTMCGTGDPLRAQISAFHHWQECICVTRGSFCSARWALAPSLCSRTIDEVYANVSARPTIGIFTRWFCGQAAACKAADSPGSVASRREALRRALNNMRTRFVWVGVLERFEDSLRLLAQVHLLTPSHTFSHLLLEDSLRLLAQV